MHLVPQSAGLAPKIAPLFTGDPPVAIRLWAILTGVICARIVVDDPERPGLAFLQELAEGSIFVGGRPTAGAVAEAFALLRARQEVVVCLCPGDGLASLLPDAPDYDGIAIDFTDRSPGVALGSLMALPPGYHLRPFCAELAPQMAGFDYYITMFGSLERAVRDTFGYCVMHGEAVVSEAIAGPVAGGMAELGVNTAAAHRRLGLATAASARTVLEVEARGYRPFWNAAEQNLPSVALARRLGFRTERPARVLAWPRTG